MSNRRIFYACQAVGIAADGSTSYQEVRGLQSVGINTTFNLQQVFEIGMISIYENIEGVADVEVTLEKVLDGFPLLYHLGTQGSTSATLVGRSNKKAILALSITDDTQEAASGTPSSTCVVSGCFVSQVSYKIGIDGNATESVTMVANNKVWNTGATGKWTPNFEPVDSTGWDADPYNESVNFSAQRSASGIAQRQHLNMDKSTFPTQIPGIDASGKNTLNTSLNCFNTSFQSASASATLGREQILELGRKAPYFRYTKFPVEVTAEFEVLAKGGDNIEVTESGSAFNSYNGNNLKDQTIKLVLNEGTVIDLGTKNKMQSCNYQGGGVDGNNATVTYSFRTFNDFTIKHPVDPTTALRSTADL
ncbi:hypothetical protein EBU24_01865 [bacterium]|nr:hypothetical protein [bacterium]